MGGWAENFAEVSGGFFDGYMMVDTPQKINMEPENRPLEKENHLPNHHFQVLC